MENHKKTFRPWSRHIHFNCSKTYVVDVCYRKRQENIYFTFSVPSKTMLKLKIIPKPVRFTNFGVNSLEMLVGMWF